MIKYAVWTAEFTFETLNGNMRVLGGR